LNDGYWMMNSKSKMQNPKLRAASPPTGL